MSFTSTHTADIATILKFIILQSILLKCLDIQKLLIFRESILGQASSPEV